MNTDYGLYYKIICNNFCELIVVVYNFIKKIPIRQIDDEDGMNVVQHNDGTKYYVIYKKPDNTIPKYEFITGDDIKQFNGCQTHSHVVELYNSRGNRYHNLFRYGLLNGKMPPKTDNTDMFKYIVTNVELYRRGVLSKKDECKFNEIPNWKWEYECLTPKGIKTDAIFDKICKSQPLDPIEIKRLKKIKNLGELEKFPPIYQRKYFLLETQINEILNSK